MREQLIRRFPQGKKLFDKSVTFIPFLPLFLFIVANCQGEIDDSDPFVVWLEGENCDYSHASTREIFAYDMLGR